MLDENLRKRLVAALQALEFLADSADATERNQGLSLEAAELVKELTALSPRMPVQRPQEADPRILLVEGRARLVAPNRREGGSRSGVYYNGRLLVETRSTDSLGAPVWSIQRELEWPKRLDARDPGTEALMVLLTAGHRFDDRELREWQKA